MENAISGLFNLFFITILGFFAAKTNFINKQNSSAISFVLIKIGYPAMLLFSFWKADRQEVFIKGGQIAIASLILTLLYFILGKLVFKKLPEKKAALFTLMLGIGNVAYIGLPVMTAFFGEEAAFTLLIFTSISDILLWSLHYTNYLAEDKIPFKKLALNPCILAFIGGILLSYFKVEVSSVAVKTLESLSALVSPLSLLYLGASLASYPIKNLFKDKQNILLSLTRVLILPIVLSPFFFYFFDDKIAFFMTIIASCPTPIIAIIWASDSDEMLEASINCFIITVALFFIFIVPLIVFASTVIFK